MSAPGNKRRVAGNSRDEWETPEAFFARVDEEFEIEHDVCATAENAKVKHFYSGPCGPDENGRCWCGLCLSWSLLRCWMNPPYSEVSTWCKKASEAAQYGAVVVALLPASTGERWFHDWVLYRASEVRLIRGRLQFVPPEGVKASSNTGGSVLAIYRPGPAPLHGAHVYGWAWRL